MEDILEGLNDCKLLMCHSCKNIIIENNKTLICKCGLKYCSNCWSDANSQYFLWEANGFLRNDKGSLLIDVCDSCSYICSYICFDSEDEKMLINEFKVFYKSLNEFEKRLIYWSLEDHEETKILPKWTNKESKEAKQYFKELDGTLLCDLISTLINTHKIFI